MLTFAAMRKLTKIAINGLIFVAAISVLMWVLGYSPIYTAPLSLPFLLLLLIDYSNKPRT
jgi:hypothetical protein